MRLFAEQFLHSGEESGTNRSDDKRDERFKCSLPPGLERLGERPQRVRRLRVDPVRAAVVIRGEDVGEDGGDLVFVLIRHERGLPCL